MGTRREHSVQPPPPPTTTPQRPRPEARQPQHHEVAVQRSTRLRREELRERRSGGNTRTGFLSSLRSLQRPGLAIWTKRSTWFPQISQLGSSTSSSGRESA